MQRYNTTEMLQLLLDPH